MTKQEAIVNLSAIFNRGSSKDEETNYFNKKKHEDLLTSFLEYVQNSSDLIGNPKILKTQALNDHGVDLIVEFPNGTKIGLQIKSHFDVKEKDFAIKVKAQMAESQFHGLNKWYLFICSPLKDSKGDYASKISHLMNELSSYKTSYHAIFSPQQSHNILTKGKMNIGDFNSIKNQFFLAPVDWAQLLLEIKSEPKVLSYLGKIEIESETVATNADLYSDYNGCTEPKERETSIEYLNDLQGLLKKLSKQTREFLFVTLERAVGNETMAQKILTPCQDLENYLNISSEKINKEVAILERHGIAELDDDYGSGIWYVAIRKTNGDFNILNDVKEFCKKYGKPLKDIIVNLNFSHFDK